MSKVPTIRQLTALRILLVLLTYIFCDYIINDSIIQVGDVQEHIGIHRDYNTFELQNALGEKNNSKVISIVDYFITNPKKFPLPPIIGILFAFFSKLLIIHSIDTKSQKLIAEKMVKLRL